MYEESPYRIIRNGWGDFIVIGRDRNTGEDTTKMMLQTVEGVDALIEALQKARNQ